MNRTNLQLIFCCLCLLVSGVVLDHSLDKESSELNEGIFHEIDDVEVHSEDEKILSKETRNREDLIDDLDEETKEKSVDKLKDEDIPTKTDHKRTKKSHGTGEHGRRRRRAAKHVTPGVHIHEGKHEKHEKHEEHEEDDEEDDHEEHHDSHDAHAWKYYGIYGPANWSIAAPDCSPDRRRQTPIDIRTSHTKVDETMSDIELVITNPTKGQGITMTNNGHTVNLVFDNPMHVTGGNLGNAYQVAGVHFHWGVSDYTGSEHTINGKRFPLEMHVVSYDKHRYSDIGAALKGENSLAVLGVLFTISEHDNPSIEPIISNLMSVQLKGTSTRMRHFYLSSLLPSKYRTNFYRYLGSLTTPPCSEVVIWSVFEHTVGISSSQMEYFRQLFEGKNSADEPQFLGYNWRPIQQLHGRTVVRSFIHQSVHHHHPTTQAPMVQQINQVAAMPAHGQMDCQVKTSSAFSIKSNKRFSQSMTLFSTTVLVFILNAIRS